MIQDPNLIISIIVGAVAVFLAGFGAGRYIEKSSNERKQISERLEKLENKFVSGIQDDPVLATWMRANIEQLMKLLSKFEGGSKNG